MLSNVTRSVLKHHRSLVTRQFSASTNLIINAVGEDRLGIVSDISGRVIHVGGNVGESVAAKLGSNFSLLMNVEVPAAKVNDLKSDLEMLTDLHATVLEAGSLAAEDSGVPAYQAHFSLTGADHPGIMHKITTAMAQHGLSVDSLETDQQIAPHGGSTLFCMQGFVSSKKEVDHAAFEEQLVDLGDSMNCEVEIEIMTEDDEDFMQG